MSVCVCIYIYIYMLYMAPWPIWSHIANVAVVSCAANLPRKDIRNLFGHLNVGPESSTKTRILFFGCVRSF